MELYGFQQSLAKLQLSLEKAQGNYQSLGAARVQVCAANITSCWLLCGALAHQRACWVGRNSTHTHTHTTAAAHHTTLCCPATVLSCMQAEQEVAQLRTKLDEHHATNTHKAQRVRDAVTGRDTQQQLGCAGRCSARAAHAVCPCTNPHLRPPTHAQAEAVQRELDRLGSTLRQIGSYNESMRGEIAVTRRAAAAAEEALQKLEKEKQQQDYLIDDLQARVCGPCAV